MYLVCKIPLIHQLEVAFPFEVCKWKPLIEVNGPRERCVHLWSFLPQASLFHPLAHMKLYNVHLVEYRKTIYVHCVYCIFMTWRWAALVSLAIKAGNCHVQQSSLHTSVGESDDSDITAQFGLDFRTMLKWVLKRFFIVTTRPQKKCHRGQKCTW